MTTPVQCDACRSALLDDAVFCHACGAPLAGVPPAAGRASATVLSIDAFGSIGTDQRLDAAQWHEVVEGFFSVVSSTVQHHGGAVGRLAGDGVEVLFGMPVPLESHATRACHAALDIRERLHALAASIGERTGVQLSSRMGLASGEVVLGAPASATTVTTLARRVRQLAAPGGICLAAETARQTGDDFALSDAGEIAAPGAGDRQRAFELLAARDRGLVGVAADIDARSPLCGRARELAELARVLQDTARHGARIVGVVGEPGVGKSRLVDELAARQRARGVPVHVTRCDEQSRGTPFHTTVPFLRSAFGIRRDDGRESVRARILAILQAVDPALLDTASLLATAFGVADPAEAARATQGRSPALDFARVLRALLGKRRPPAPSLFVIDDQHWMDPGTDAVLGELLREPPDGPLMVVLTYRPGHARPWMRGEQFRELPLLPLADSDTLRLTRSVMGDHRSLQSLREHLVARAAGNPFFVEEAVLALAASGTLEGPPHRYRLRDATAAATLPHTIDAVLADRIACLGAQERAVLQAAAVVGHDLGPTLLAALTGLSHDDVRATLSSLERAELLTAADDRDGATHRFRHQLLQRIAYDSLAPTRRARLHRRVAAELIDPHGTRGNPHAGRIAAHAEAAGDLLEAARWHRRAAVQLLAWNPGQSYAHWRRVLSCSEGLGGDDAARLRLAACEAVVRLGFHHGLPADEAEALAGEGRQIAERFADVRMQALLSTAIGSLRGSTGDLDAGIAHQRTALQHAERTGEAGLALMTGAQLLFSHRVAGRTVEGLRLADALLERYRRGDGRALGADVVWLRQLELGRAMLLLDRGRLDAGSDELTRVLGVLRGEDSPVVYAWALSLSAAVVRFAGNPAPVLAARIEEAYELTRRCAVPSLVGRAQCSLAILRLCQGRWHEALTCAEQADETMRELGHTFYVDSDPRLMLSYARFGLGDIAGARTAAYEAMQHAFRSGARLGQIDTLAALGRLLVRYGTLEQIVEGRSMLRHGLALVRRCRARSREPFFWLELAGLERRAGNDPRALACERRAVRQLRAMNAHGHLPRAAVPRSVADSVGAGDRPSR